MIGSSRVNDGGADRPAPLSAYPSRFSVIADMPAATRTIPIVFGAAGDPVKEGLVASLNRPGGNLTGVNFFTAELIPKRMQLLREVVPAANRIALLVNPTDQENYRPTLHDVQAAAGSQQILAIEVATGRQIDAGFATMSREKADALFVAPGSFFNTSASSLPINKCRPTLELSTTTSVWKTSYGIMATFGDTARYDDESAGMHCVGHDESAPRVLADVDADRADGFPCLLRCAHRMLLELCASQHRSAVNPLSAAGPSH